MKKSGKETPVRLVNGGQNETFLEMCEKYHITPTKRQLSKFRNKKGRLYNAVRGA